MSYIEDAIDYVSAMLSFIRKAMRASESVGHLTVPLMKSVMLTKTVTVGRTSIIAGVPTYCRRFATCIHPNPTPTHPMVLLRA